MRKINDFDKVEASTGEFKSNRIPAGGYVVAVTNVTDVPEKNYLRVEFDVCEGEHKLFFTNIYKEDKREKKYWPNGGTMIRSYTDKALPMFKGFTTAVENSNPNYHWDFDETKLKNKKFGVVIGDEEYEYTNSKGEHKVGVRNYVQAVRSADVIKKGDFKIPELKKLKQTVETSQSKPDFVNPFADEAPVENETVTSSPFDADDSNPFA